MKSIVMVIGCAVLVAFFLVPACADAQEVVLPVGGSAQFEYYDEGWIESDSPYNGVFVYVGISNEPANGSATAAAAFSGCYGPYYSNGSYWFYWYAYVAVDYQCEGVGADNVQVIVFTYAGGQAGTGNFPCNNVQIDLDVDADQDGDIDDADDLLEVNPGGRFFVNDDDDNDNGIPDNVGDDEVGPVSYEDDLEKITISLNPASVTSGRVVLRRNNPNVRVWSSPVKGGGKEILVTSDEKVWDMSNPDEKTAFNYVKDNLWVEGMVKSDCMLTAYFQDHEGNDISTPDEVSFQPDDETTFAIFGDPALCLPKTEVTEGTVCKEYTVRYCKISETGGGYHVELLSDRVDKVKWVFPGGAAAGHLTLAAGMDGDDEVTRITGTGPEYSSDLVHATEHHKVRICFALSNYDAVTDLMKTAPKSCYQAYDVTLVPHEDEERRLESRTFKMHVAYPSTIRVCIRNVTGSPNPDLNGQVNLSPDYLQTLEDRLNAIFGPICVQVRTVPKGFVTSLGGATEIQNDDVQDQLTVSVNGGADTVVDIASEDLSGGESIAAAITAALASANLNADCAWDGCSYTLRSGTTGEDSRIVAKGVDGSAGDLLNLRAADGAAASHGWSVADVHLSAANDFNDNNSIKKNSSGNRHSITLKERGLLGFANLFIYRAVPGGGETPATPAIPQLAPYSLVTEFETGVAAETYAHELGHQIGFAVRTDSRSDSDWRKFGVINVGIEPGADRVKNLMYCQKNDRSNDALVTDGNLQDWGQVIYGDLAQGIPWK